MLTLLAPGGGLLEAGGVATPTELWMADTVVRDRTLTMFLHLTIQSGMGYRIERLPGANQTPGDPAVGELLYPSSDLYPSESLFPGEISGSTSPWDLVEEVDSSAGGTLLLEYEWPFDDADYTVAAWEFDGASYSAEPIAANVFTMPLPVIGPAGDTFVSMEVTTRRAGYPRIQLARDAAFASVSLDYDASVDGVGGWRLIPAESGIDVSDPDAGDPLPIGGWPEDSIGAVCRRSITRVPGTRYIRAAHASGAT